MKNNHDDASDKKEANGKDKNDVRRRLDKVETRVNDVEGRIGDLEDKKQQEERT